MNVVCGALGGLTDGRTDASLRQMHCIFITEYGICE